MFYKGAFYFPDQNYLMKYKIRRKQRLACSLLEYKICYNKIMVDKASKIHIDTNHIKKILKMSHDEQQNWLVKVLDYVKDSGLEKELFEAAKNILNDSTINDVKRWYDAQK
jgi:isopropylmalate/homocitrate/citramalate synthase